MFGGGSSVDHPGAVLSGGRLSAAPACFCPAGRSV